MKKKLQLFLKAPKIQITGCSITLLEDAKVEANQPNLDYILKYQENFDNDMGLVSKPK